MKKTREDLDLTKIVIQFRSLKDAIIFLSARNNSTIQVTVNGNARSVKAIQIFNLTQLNRSQSSVFC